MKKTVLILLLLVVALRQGEAQPLSPDARLSLLVCAPGGEIYSYFGHAALRMNDPQTGRDLVFNYGAFSFDAPNFVWRFAKGETDYQLVVQRMSSFMQEYTDDKRSVTEYFLDLTPDERQRLFDALVLNYQPENRVYRYNHFHDNCATRLRDQIEKVTGPLTYDLSSDKEQTFRELIDLYLYDNTWSGLGIKLALGVPADHTASFREKMFLPDFLAHDISTAMRERDGAKVRVVASSVKLIEEPAWKQTFSFSSPLVVVLLLLAVVALFTYREHRLQIRYGLLDFILLFSFGIAGGILTFLTFVSVIPSTAWNLNLIWCWPTHLLFAFLWLEKSWRPSLMIYWKLTTVVLLLFLPAMLVLPQSFHYLVVPFCVILLLRSATMWRSYALK